MGRKCSAYGCNTGYLTNKTSVPVTVYAFPKDKVLRAAWGRAMPNGLTLDKITDNMGLCGIHFPDCKDWKQRGNHRVPNEVPTYFPNCPPSTIGTKPPPKRPTKRSSAASRCPDPDIQLKAFRESDILKLDNFTETVKDKLSLYSGTIQWNQNGFNFLSETREGPIHKVSIFFRTVGLSASKTVSKITLDYEAYVGLRRVKHPARPLSINCWSSFDEVISYVHKEQEHNDDDRFAFVERQVFLLNIPKNNRVYDFNDVNMAFSFYTLNRHLYAKLRKVLQLPSISTLKKVTRASTNIDDDRFFTSFFKAQEERSRSCTLIADEIYVKSCLTYRGMLT